MAAIPEAGSVTVVVCAYTMARWTDLRGAVESLLLQTRPPHEVIVVVDHDEMLLACASAWLPGSPTVLENTGRPGLSAARNTGLAAARSQVVAFLDDDAFASPSWLEHLLGGYEDDRVLGVGGRIVPLWEHQRPAWAAEEFDWVFGCSYQGLPQGRRAVRNMIGANMSFRRDALLAAGGFRTDMGRTRDRALGAEETDACIRMTQAAPEGRFLHEPRAVVRHRVPESRARWSYFRERCYCEGLSKARLARAVGSADALSSERRHVLEALPKGFFQGLGDSLSGRDAWGVARSAGIAAGLTVTAAGYVAGHMAARGEKEAPAYQGGGR